LPNSNELELVLASLKYCSSSFLGPDKFRFTLFDAVLRVNQMVLDISQPRMTTFLLQGADTAKLSDCRGRIALAHESAFLF
jgi:hypothetical protein